MTTITTTHDTQDAIPAVARNVQVSEDSITFSVIEDETNGEVYIPELDMKLSTGKRKALSAALSVWKYGIEPVA